VLPLAEEAVPVAGYIEDPVDDMAASHCHGILKKYRGRALMVTTGACAIHCRYCFRRHFPYADETALRHQTDAIETIRTMPDVSELILSGGDPLTLSDARLEGLLAAAERLPHLRRLRIHTRLPVVLPERVTPGLTAVLSRTRLQTVVVIHANHPQEVTAELGRAMENLAAAGATLLNQSVLLKSVNDDADTLAGLSESLFGIRVMPYYLHLLDRVAGAAHFDVPLARAERLLQELRERLPGYLVPRMVREVPGAPYKTPILQL
jgi:EF-P beta-lysylation protein EpmB